MMMRGLHGSFFVAISTLNVKLPLKLGAPLQCSEPQLGIEIPALSLPICGSFACTSTRVATRVLYALS